MSFPIELFETKMGDVDYDDFIEIYEALKRALDENDLKEAQKQRILLISYDVSHPYATFLLQRYRVVNGELPEESVVHKLEKEYPNNLFLQYSVIWLKKVLGKQEEVMAALTHFLEHTPRYYPAEQMMAEELLERKEYKEAKKYTVDLMDYHGQHSAMIARFQEINRYLIPEYEKQQADGSLTFEDAVECCKCYYESGEIGKCRELLQTLKPSNGTQRFLFYSIRNKLYLHEEQFQKALENIKKWNYEFRLLPKDSSIYKRKKQYAMAIRYYKAVCYFYLNQGKIRASLKYQEGIRKALKSLDVGLDGPACEMGMRMDCLALRVHILLEAGLYDECIATAKQGLEVFPHMIPLHVEMQTAYFELGEWQIVIHLFYEIHKQYNQFPKIYYNAAKVFLEARQFDDAKKILEMATEAKVQDISLEFLANRLRYLENYDSEEIAQVRQGLEEILEHLKKDDFEEPSIYEVLVEIQNCDMLLEDYDKALKTNAFIIEGETRKKKKKEENECVEAYRMQARILWRMDRYEEAIALFEEFLDPQEDHTAYLFEMGDCYIELDRWEEAQQTLETVVRLNPEYPRIYRKMAILYLYRIRQEWNPQWYEMALQYMKKQLSLDENAGDSFNLGLIYEEGYDLVNAALCYERAVELQQGLNHNTIQRLAHVYALMGERERATELLENALQQDDMPTSQSLSVVNELLRRYATSEQFDKADALLLQYESLFVQQKTRYPYTFLASLYLWRGKFPRSAALYEKASTLFDADTQGSAYAEERCKMYLAMGMCGRLRPILKRFGIEFTNDQIDAFAFEKASHYATLLQTQLKKKLRTTLPDITAYYYDMAERNYKKAKAQMEESILRSHNKHGLWLNFAEIAYYAGDQKTVNHCLEEFMKDLEHRDLDAAFSQSKDQKHLIGQYIEIHFYAGRIMETQKYWELFRNSKNCADCAYKACTCQLHFEAYLDINDKDYARAMEKVMQSFPINMASNSSLLLIEYLDGLMKDEGGIEEKNDHRH
jgi:tetratricopeptide (TPR) repeat protein